MDRTNRWMILLFAVVFVALFAWEAAHSGEPDPCAGDVAKFCKDVTPGGGRIAKCLKANANDLSPACRAGIEERRNSHRDLRKACAGDARKFCKDATPGGGGVVRCLEANEQDLSPACREELSEARKRSR